MVRPKGATNKPKSVGELIKQLDTAAKLEGKKFVYDLVDRAPISDEEKEAAKSKLHERFANLEIELDEAETITYKCGSCGESLSSQISRCPACGVNLTW